MFRTISIKAILSTLESRAFCTKPQIIGYIDSEMVRFEGVRLRELRLYESETLFRRLGCHTLRPRSVLYFQPPVSGRLCLVPRVSAYGRFDSTG